MSIAIRLRTLRERVGVGWVELAAAANVSIPTVSEWKSGKKKPGRENLIAVAQFYGVTTDFLIHGGVAVLVERTQNEEEIKLLRLFRESPDAAKKAVLTLLTFGSGQ